MCGCVGVCVAIVLPDACSHIRCSGHSLNDTEVFFEQIDRVKDGLPFCAVLVGNKWHVIPTHATPHNATRDATHATCHMTHNTTSVICPDISLSLSRDSDDVDRRQVESAEAIAMARRWNVPYVEATAKESVDHIFAHLLYDMEAARGTIVLPTGAVIISLEAQPHNVRACVRVRMWCDRSGTCDYEGEGGTTGHQENGG